jgi:EmrB/QacA subfamily drug resistance transporter
MALNDTATRTFRLSPIALAGLLAGPFLAMVDSVIVNVALPDISSQLKSGLDVAQWVLSGYLLALAAGLAASAYLAKRFGTRSVYLASMIGFTLSSALCAVAPNISVLIALRVLQGLCGAPLVPLAMTMLLGESSQNLRFPPAAGVILFLAPAMGPTLGGVLIHLGGWPLIFLINVPFGLIGALGVLRLPSHYAGGGDASVRFDIFGILLLAGGSVLALYGGTLGPQRGWSSPQVWPLLVAGCALLLLYVIWALVRKHPAIDLKLLRHAQTALAVFISALAAIVLFAMLFLLPIYMEELQGLSVLVAGLALLPQGVVTGLGTVLGDRLGARWGVRRSAFSGMLVLTLATAALLTLNMTTPAWVTALILSARGLALGLTIQPLLTGMVASLAGDEVNDGNTLFNVAQRLGGSLGISLLATFFAAREQVHVGAVLQQLGLPASLAGQTSSTSAMSQLPAAVRTTLGDAAIAGFHDTILALVAVSAFGCLVTLLLRSSRKPARPTSVAVAKPETLLASH